MRDEYNVRRIYSYTHKIQTNLHELIQNDEGRMTVIYIVSILSAI